MPAPGSHGGDGHWHNDCLPGPLRWSHEHPGLADLSSIPAVGVGFGCCRRLETRPEISRTEKGAEMKEEPILSIAGPRPSANEGHHRAMRKQLTIYVHDKICMIMDRSPQSALTCTRLPAQCTTTLVSTAFPVAIAARHKPGSNSHRSPVYDRIRNRRNPHRCCNSWSGPVQWSDRRSVNCYGLSERQIGSRKAGTLTKAAFDVGGWNKSL